MRCKNCGEKIQKGNTFCPECGMPTEKGGKGLIIATAILAVVVAVFVVCFLFGYNDRKVRKFEKSIHEFEEVCKKYPLGDLEEEWDSLVRKAQDAIDEKETDRYKELEEKFDKFEKELITYSEELSEYENQGEEYQQKFSVLFLSEEQERTYKRLLEELDDEYKDASLSEVEKTIDEINQFYKQCEQENIELVKEKKQAVNNYPSGNLLQAEKELLNQYKKEAEKYEDEKNYCQAIEEYEKCSSSIEKFERSSNYEFNVEQIDVTEFPTVKLYVNAYDSNTDTCLSISKEHLALRLLNNGVYDEVSINQVHKLNERENLNTCLVADVSGSMYSQIGVLKSSMINFARCMQYYAGDEVALISFDNIVNLNVDFTNDVSLITNEIENLCIGNCTALYDALYVAVCKTASTEGAKCVIAFTDGLDNVSTKTAADVIDIANMYGIPVYLVGIGSDVDNIALQQISDMTGGSYWNIFDAGKMEDIYNSIYTKNKEMYLVEYTSMSQNETQTQNVYLAYDDSSTYMGCETSFQPTQLKTSINDYEEIIQSDALPNDQVEDEVLRIRGIYNNIVDNRTNNRYATGTPASVVTTYSANGKIECIIIEKGINNVQYTRYYYYENEKLIFAYLEDADSHRLYFYHDRLFRWRYASNSVKYSEAENHDNEDSNEFRKWEQFALDEGYRYIN